MAPNVADRDSTLRTSAFTGRSTLRVKANRMTSVDSAIKPRANGNTPRRALSESTLRAARPVTRAGLGPGSARTVATRSDPAPE